MADEQPLGPVAPAPGSAIPQTTAAESGNVPTQNQAIAAAQSQAPAPVLTESQQLWNTVNAGIMAPGRTGYTPEWQAAVARLNEISPGAAASIQNAISQNPMSSSELAAQKAQSAAQQYSEANAPKPFTTQNLPAEQQASFYGSSVGTQGQIGTTGLVVNLNQPAVVLNEATKAAEAAMNGVPQSVQAPGTFSVYVPYGERTQQQLDNIAAVRYDESGQVGFYQALYTMDGQQRNITNLVSSGGRNALQSGMFSLSPLTPDVRLQENVERYAANANQTEAALIRANPAGFSRLGAESYGGMVRPLDNRTIGSTGATLSTYPAATGNLAALVSPQAVNYNKSQLPTSSLPWGEQVSSYGPIIEKVGVDLYGSPSITPTQFTEMVARYGSGYSPSVTAPAMGAYGASNIGPQVGSSPLYVNTAIPATLYPAPIGVSFPGVEQQDYKENAFVSGFMKSASLAPGGMIFALGAAGVSDVLSGNVKNSPAGQFVQSVQDFMKGPAVTKEQYESNLAGYQSEKALYESDLSGYNAQLAQYQAGGSTDEAAYKTLQTKYGALQNQENALSSRYVGLQRQEATIQAEQNKLNPITALDKVLAPVTTDVTGLGRLSDLILKSGNVKDENLVFGLGLVSNIQQSPIEVYEMGAFAGGYAAAKSALGYGVAAAATSETTALSTVGRALSTPFAADVGKVIETGAGIYFVVTGVANAASQPTPALRGKAAGLLIAEGIGFYGGYGAVEFPAVENVYAGKGFFSGKPEIGPLEKLQFKAETAARSVTSSNPAAYLDVATIAAGPARTTEPMVKGEPNFAELSRSGPYAEQIKTVLTEQPSSVYGSSTVRSQYPADILENTYLRYGKDVDAFIENKQMALNRLSELTKLSTEGAKDILDLHSGKDIPKNYPGLRSTETTTTDTKDYVSLFDTLMGSPYRNIALPRGSSEVITPRTTGYSGELTYEAVQVQMGRKSAGVADVIQNPIAKGFRAEKDIYDFVTVYEAQKLSALKQGVPEKSFSQSDAAMQRLLDRTITIGTVKGQRTAGEAPTRTVKIRDLLNEAREQAEVGKLERAQPQVDVERGYASSVIRAGAPSAFMSSAPASVFSSGGYGSVIPSSNVASPATERSSIPSVFRSSPSAVASGGAQSPYPMRAAMVSPSPTAVPSAMLASVSSPAASVLSPSAIPSQMTAPSAFRSPGAPSSPAVSSPPSYVPPSYPPASPPSKQVPPPPYVPPAYPSFPGTSWPSQGKKKKEKRFVEYFSLGLDRSVTGRIMYQAKPAGGQGPYPAKPKIVRQPKMANPFAPGAAPRPAKQVKQVRVRDPFAVQRGGVPAMRDPFEDIGLPKKKKARRR